MPKQASATVTQPHTKDLRFSCGHPEEVSPAWAEQRQPAEASVWESQSHGGTSMLLQRQSAVPWGGNDTFTPRGSILLREHQNGRQARPSQRRGGGRAEGGKEWRTRGGATKGVQNKPSAYRRTIVSPCTKAVGCLPGLGLPAARWLWVYCTCYA